MFGCCCHTCLSCLSVWPSVVTWSSMLYDHRLLIINYLVGCNVPLSSDMLTSFLTDSKRKRQIRLPTPLDRLERVNPWSLTIGRNDKLTMQCVRHYFFWSLGHKESERKFNKNRVFLQTVNSRFTRFEPFFGELGILEVMHMRFILSSWSTSYMIVLLVNY